MAPNLDRHQFASGRVSLGEVLYVGYSTGNLPFDRKDGQALEIGFSNKLF